VRCRRERLSGSVYIAAVVDERLGNRVYPGRERRTQPDTEAPPKIQQQTFFAKEIGPHAFFFGVHALENSRFRPTAERALQKIGVLFQRRG
jgi:hypothetical protein